MESKGPPTGYPGVSWLFGSPCVDGGGIRGGEECRCRWFMWMWPQVLQSSVVTVFTSPAAKCRRYRPKLMLSGHDAYR